MTLSWRWLAVGLLAGAMPVLGQSGETKPAEAATEEQTFDYTASPESPEDVAKLMEEQAFTRQLASCKVSIADAMKAAEKETGGKAAAVNIRKDLKDLVVEVEIWKGNDRLMVRLDPADGKILKSEPAWVPYFPGQMVDGQPTKTESGLMYYDVKAGKGDIVMPKKEDDAAAVDDEVLIKMHYAAWLMDGKAWQSSYQFDRPMDILTTNLPEGWKEGVSSMKAGGIRKLIVPGPQGFGQRQVSNAPPGAAMIVDVEVLEVSRMHAVTPEELATARKLGVAVEGEPETTEKGVYYWDVKVGDGDQPADMNARVTVSYTGWLASDGSQFDTSEGKPMQPMALSRFVPGWGEAVSTMRVGGKRKLVIPAEFAYRLHARPNIPAGSTLVFDVELKSIAEATPPRQPQGNLQIKPFNGSTPNAGQKPAEKESGEKKPEENKTEAEETPAEQ